MSTAIRRRVRRAVRTVAIADRRVPRGVADGDVVGGVQTTPDLVRAAIDALSPGDLVVLVQSTSFRLNEFRFRLELFDRKLKTIEHPHLGRMPDSELETFIDALAYDPDYYRTVGPALMERINRARASS